MVKTELVKRSPLRILEKSTHGGLGKGKIGVFAGEKGVGKTACLVHVATDGLFQNKHVIHLSFSNDASHIVTWYEEIFSEIAKRYKLENAMDIHNEVIRNRIIMNVIQDGVHWEQIEKNIQALITTGNFSVDTIVIDGYDFSKATCAEFKTLQAFAANLGLNVWFSVSTGMTSDTTIPSVLSPVLDEIAVIVLLRHKKTHIHLELVKDHGKSIAANMHLKLDTHSLLIAEEK